MIKGIILLNVFIWMILNIGWFIKLGPEYMFNVIMDRNEDSEVVIYWLFTLICLGPIVLLFVN